MMEYMVIGVFDSGIGGAAVAAKLEILLPEASVISVNDHEHVPYGNKSDQEIISLTNSAIQPLLERKCDVIVIACNTATTTAIAFLRSTYPNTHFVGLEPMVKPAVSLTRSQKIAVLATVGTLRSDRYKFLKETYGYDITFFEPDCSDWASKIEDGQAQSIDLNSTLIPLLNSGVDTIVLGCTHYHWVKQDIQKIVGDSALILEPTDAIARRIEEITSFSKG